MKRINNTYVIKRIFYLSNCKYKIHTCTYIHYGFVTAWHVQKLGKSNIFVNKYTNTHDE